MTVNFAHVPDTDIKPSSVPIDAGCSTIRTENQIARLPIELVAAYRIEDYSVSGCGYIVMPVRSYQALYSTKNGGLFLMKQIRVL